MSKRLLKIIFIDKTRLEYCDFLGDDIYDESRIIYKFIDSCDELKQIVNHFDNEGYNYILGNDEIYIIGFIDKQIEQLKESMDRLSESFKGLSFLDFNELLDDEPNENIPPDTEKDIIDKLAEKYRKEAEDKGKFN